jgi:hypothetical protein
MFCSINKQKIQIFGNAIQSTYFAIEKDPKEQKSTNLPTQKEKTGSSYSITKNKYESKTSSWFQDMKPETVAWLAGLLQGEAQFLKR